MSGLDFSEWSDERILDALAWEQEDFTEDAQKSMWQSAQLRGITMAHVQEQRLQRLVDKDTKYNCLECKKELVLEADDISKGTFTCPLCGLEQSINFSSRTIRQQAALETRSPSNNIGVWLIPLGIIALVFSGSLYALFKSLAGNSKIVDLLYIILIVMFLLLLGTVISVGFAARAAIRDRPPIYYNNSFITFVGVLMWPAIGLFIILMLMDWKWTLAIAVVGLFLGSYIARISEIVIVIPMYKLFMREEP